MASLESNDQVNESVGVSEKELRSFTFTWIDPAEEVYVTGEFDNWEGTVKLERKADVFSKDVLLGNVTEDIPYKFIVDGEWKFDPAQPQIMDDQHNINNVLHLDRMTTTKIVVKSAFDPTADPSGSESITAETPASGEEDEAHYPRREHRDDFWWAVITL